MVSIKNVGEVEMQNKLVIESVREDGKRFRPSDWIERLSANMGTFGSDHRLHYAESVKPGIVDGEKCLIVNPSLESENPAAYSFIMGFAKSNSLRFHLGSGATGDTAA